jgi:UDP-glucuronate 4-epimerase
MGHVYSKLYGIRFLALRLFTVYGPRQRPDLAMHKFAKLMLTGRAIPVYGDGTTRRDYTHVADIIEGFVRAIEYDDSSYEIFNIGSTSPVTLRELVLALEEALGVDAILDRRPEQPGDVPQTWADVTLASEKLGYFPQVSLRDGMASFAEWIRSTHATEDTSEGASGRASKGVAEVTAAAHSTAVASLEQAVNV